MDKKVIINSIVYTIRRGFAWLIWIIISYRFIFNISNWKPKTIITISALIIGFFLGHSAGSSFEFLEKISKRIIFIIILGIMIFISTFISMYYINYIEEWKLLLFDVTCFSIIGIVSSISDGIKFRVRNYTKSNRNDESK